MPSSSNSNQPRRQPISDALNNNSNSDAAAAEQMSDRTDELRYWHSRKITPPLASRRTSDSDVSMMDVSMETMPSSTPSRLSLGRLGLAQAAIIDDLAEEDDSSSNSMDMDTSMDNNMSIASSHVRTGRPASMTTPTTTTNARTGRLSASLPTLVTPLDDDGPPSSSSLALALARQHQQSLSSADDDDPRALPFKKMLLDRQQQSRHHVDDHHVDDDADDRPSSSKQDTKAEAPSAPSSTPSSPSLARSLLLRGETSCSPLLAADDHVSRRRHSLGRSYSPSTTTTSTNKNQSQHIIPGLLVSPPRSISPPWLLRGSSSHSARMSPPLSSSSKSRSKSKSKNKNIQPSPTTPTSPPITGIADVDDALNRLSLMSDDSDYNTSIHSIANTNRLSTRGLSGSFLNNEDIVSVSVRSSSGGYAPREYHDRVSSSITDTTATTGDNSDVDVIDYNNYAAVITSSSSASSDTDNNPTSHSKSKSSKSSKSKSSSRRISVDSSISSARTEKHRNMKENNYASNTIGNMNNIMNESGHSIGSKSSSAAKRTPKKHRSHKGKRTKSITSVAVASTSTSTTATVTAMAPSSALSCANNSVTSSPSKSSPTSNSVGSGHSKIKADYRIENIATEDTDDDDDSLVKMDKVVNVNVGMGVATSTLVPGSISPIPIDISTTDMDTSYASSRTTSASAVSSGKKKSSSSRSSTSKRATTSGSLSKSMNAASSSSKRAIRGAAGSLSMSTASLDVSVSGDKVSVSARKKDKDRDGMERKKSSRRKSVDKNTTATTGNTSNAGVGINVVSSASKSEASATDKVPLPLDHDSTRKNEILSNATTNTVVSSSSGKNSSVTNSGKTVKAKNTNTTMHTHRPTADSHPHPVTPTEPYSSENNHNNNVKRNNRLQSPNDIGSASPPDQKKDHCPSRLRAIIRRKKNKQQQQPQHHQQQQQVDQHESDREHDDDDGRAISVSGRSGTTGRASAISGRSANTSTSSSSGRSMIRRYLFLHSPKKKKHPKHQQQADHQQQQPGNNNNKVRLEKRNPYALTENNDNNNNKTVTISSIEKHDVQHNSSSPSNSSESSPLLPSLVMTPADVSSPEGERPDFISSINSSSITNNNDFNFNASMNSSSHHASLISISELDVLRIERDEHYNQHSNSSNNMGMKHSSHSEGDVLHNKQLHHAAGMTSSESNLEVLRDRDYNSMKQSSHSEGDMHHYHNMKHSSHSEGDMYYHRASGTGSSGRSINKHHDSLKFSTHSEGTGVTGLTSAMTLSTHDLTEGHAFPRHVRLNLTEDGFNPIPMPIHQEGRMVGSPSSHNEPSSSMCSTILTSYSTIRASRGSHLRGTLTQGALAMNEDTTHIINLTWSDDPDDNVDHSKRIHGKYTGPVSNDFLQPHGEGTLVIETGHECLTFHGKWDNGKLASPLSAEPSGRAGSWACAASGAGLDPSPHNSPVIQQHSPNGLCYSNAKDFASCDASTISRKGVDVKYIVNKSSKRSYKSSPMRSLRYMLGEACRTPIDMIIHRSNKKATQSAALLKKWDQVFVKRSNGLWTVAVMIDRALQPKGLLESDSGKNEKKMKHARGRQGDDSQQQKETRWATVWDINPKKTELEESMLFAINDDGATKIISKHSWGKYVRRIKG